MTFEAQEDKSLIATAATTAEPVQILNRLRLLFVSQRAGRVEIDLLVLQSERGEPGLYISEVWSILFAFEAHQVGLFVPKTWGGWRDSL